MTEEKPNTGHSSTATKKPTLQWAGTGPGFWVKFFRETILTARVPARYLARPTFADHAERCLLEQFINPP